LTIAASIWFFEGIGMVSGFNFYFMAIVSIAFDVIVPRIPIVGKRREESDE
jgi:putative Mg2+ transporter-C (MgtC) family protein